MVANKPFSALVNGTTGTTATPLAAFVFFIPVPAWDAEPPPITDDDADPDNTPPPPPAPAGRFFNAATLPPVDDTTDVTDPPALAPPPPRVNANDDEEDDPARERSATALSGREAANDDDSPNVGLAVPGRVGLMSRRSGDADAEDPPPVVLPLPAAGVVGIAVCEDFADTVGGAVVGSVIAVDGGGGSGPTWWASSMDPSGDLYSCLGARKRSAVMLLRVGGAAAIFFLRNYVICFFKWREAIIVFV
ncbi:hypothetical protein HDU87_004478 [Geranomyces variabilis]|uniref:Uncharacterized protein n=1 Tax=Geranomyces variabilis TaxID=109894 RepID=A0AAD5XLY3_9FUNG|nr:hypothetical protein HDU87_004478 [Geranomyces variabilis]